MKIFNWFKKKHKEPDIRNTRIVIEPYEYIDAQKYLFSLGCDWYNYINKLTSLSNDIDFNHSKTRMIIQIEDDYSMSIQPYPGYKMNKKKYNVVTFMEAKLLYKKLK